MKKISAATVRADFNDLRAVVHYTRAAHELGLWASERALIGRFFPRTDAPLLEAGCGAGRVTLGLWEMGYRNLTAFDFAEELVDQARSLAAERGADAIRFLQADATRFTVAADGAGGPAARFAGAPARAGVRDARAPVVVVVVCFIGTTLLPAHRAAQPGAQSHDPWSDSARSGP